jgi:hypothetical protein
MAQEGTSHAENESVWFDFDEMNRVSYEGRSWKPKQASQLRA